MTIDEIIESYEMRACLEEKMGDISNAEEHRQVAEWLRELQRAKNLLGCLTNRPCDVCIFRLENGCIKWNCVFEEVNADGDR